MKCDDDPDRLIHLLHRRGYRRVEKMAGLLRQEVFYQAPNRGGDIDGYVRLEKKPSQNAYDVSFGTACKVASELIKATEPVLRKYPIVGADLLGVPYLVLFSAGRLLKCRLINIPDRTDSRSFDQILEELVNLVLLPYVETPDLCDQAMAQLRRNDPPFEWRASNPFKRALNLAAIARVGGLGRREIADELISIRDNLAGRGDQWRLWEEKVEIIGSVIWSSQSKLH